AALVAALPPRPRPDRGRVRRPGGGVLPRGVAGRGPAPGPRVRGGAAGPPLAAPAPGAITAGGGPPVRRGAARAPRAGWRAAGARAEARRAAPPVRRGDRGGRPTHGVGPATRGRPRTGGRGRPWWSSPDGRPGRRRPPAGEEAGVGPAGRGRSLGAGTAG